MNNLLLTGHTGEEYKIMSSYTYPLMEKYAKHHSLDFLRADLYDDTIPPSWMKVINIINALEKYDQVLWIDCDVVIKKFDENMLDELQPPYIQAMVEHEVDVGYVPNAGIWAVDKKLLPVLNFMWNNKEYLLHHPWWEQSAMMLELGYSVIFINSGFCQRIRPSKLRDTTKFINAKWNHHPGDKRKVDDPNFMHITMYDDRLKKIIELTSVSSNPTDLPQMPTVS